MTCHMTEGGCSAEHMIILCCSHSYFVSCDCHVTTCRLAMALALATM